MPNGHPGCIVASAAHRGRRCNADVREAHQRATLGWRRHFRAAPDEVVGLPPPVEPACLDDLADLVSVAVESVIVVSNSIGDPKATGRHILLLCTRVKRLFQP